MNAPFPQPRDPVEEALDHLAQSIRSKVWRPVFDDDGREMEEPSYEAASPRVFGGVR